MLKVYPVLMCLMLVLVPSLGAAQGGRGGGGGQGGGGGGRPPKEDPPPEYSDNFPAIVVAAANGPGKDVLLVAEANGSNQTLLVDTSDTLPDGQRFVSIGRPIWSPDGEWVMFSGRLNGSDIGRLGVVRRDGSDLYVVPNVEGDLFDLTWSSDGRWILHSQALPVPNGWRDELFFIEVLSLEDQLFVPPVRLTLEAPELNKFDPTWSPDASQIAAMVADVNDGSFHMWEFDPDGVPSVANPQPIDPYGPGLHEDIGIVWSKGHSSWLASQAVDESTGSRDIWFFDLTPGGCLPVMLVEGASLYDWSGDDLSTTGEGEDETDTEIIFQYGPSNVWKAALTRDADGCIDGALDPVPVFTPERRSKLTAFRDAQWRR